MIDVNKYPVSEIERVTKQTRRIGLGLMGLADTLYALNIPYNSEEGFSFMSKVTEFVSYHSLRASVELAKARGAFPLFEKSDYAKAKLPFEGFYHREWWHEDWEALSKEIAQNGVRNSHTMTVAPTGSISMIAEVSSGLEPQFALVFEKHVTVGKFYYVDPEFERRIEELGLDKQAVIEEVAKNGGSVQGLNLPEDLRRVFVVAYDIPWWDHVRAQYEVQKWVSAAVSKTINMPSWVTPDDVLSAYVFAHRLGLKGITVYRDSSKGEQVLKTPAQRGEGYIAPVSNKTLELPPLSFNSVALWYTIDELTVKKIEEESLDLAGGLHAAEHAMIGVMPFHVLCDRWDIGGVSTPLHPYTGEPTIFIYDGYEGGIGISEKAAELFPELVRTTLQVVSECGCERGCPACIYSPKCGNDNRPLDKRAAKLILESVLRKLTSEV